MIDFTDVKARHRLADVARRSGIDVAGSGRAMVRCPLPGHNDYTPSTQLDLDRDRYHCFGCGAGGDVIDWVKDIEGVDTVTAVSILEERRTINAVFTSPGQSPVRATRQLEPPRFDRTTPERVAQANRSAWDYYSYKTLHARGVAYLVGRDIDVTALEAEVSAPVVGHTPSSNSQVDGLLKHLTGRGFNEDELVDSGLASRLADGSVIDFFRDRIIVPVKDASGAIAGLLGRDVTGTSRVKYLNPPTTATYRKSVALYQPTRPTLQPDGAVIVCEGPIDALAIAANAASTGLSNRFAPVAACGRVLSDHHIQSILALHPRAPVLAADGDDPGRQANVDWARRMLTEGRESVITDWPEGYDPASWLSAHGASGILAVTRRGCLQDRSGTLRPRHCAAILTGVDFPDNDADHPPDPTDFSRAMAAATANLPPPARKRYVAAAAFAFDMPRLPWIGPSRLAAPAPCSPQASVSEGIPL